MILPEPCCFAAQSQGLRWAGSAKAAAKATPFSAQLNEFLPPAVYKPLEIS